MSSDPESLRSGVAVLPRCRLCVCDCICHRTCIWCSRPHKVYRRICNGRSILSVTAFSFFQMSFESSLCSPGPAKTIDSPNRAFFSDPSTNGFCMRFAAILTDRFPVRTPAQTHSHTLYCNGPPIYKYPLPSRPSLRSRNITIRPRNGKPGADIERGGARLCH